MTTLADRSLELHVDDRVTFGVGAIDTLAGVTRAVSAVDDGTCRVFVVTDHGVVSAGVIDRVRALLEAAGMDVGIYAEVEPNPGTASILRGSEALLAFGLAGTAIVAVGGGSSMDSAKAISLHAANGGDVLALGYHRDDVAPGAPLIAVPTTAGTGAETNTFGVITDEAVGRKDYVGHPSVRPISTILDPALTVGLPPAATAATGVDAMTHAIEALLSRNQNPYAEALAVDVIHTVGTWLPRAIADGSDLEARSRMLMASHIAGLAQASGTGSGLVHALGHAIGTRGRLPHGLALAVVLPEVLAFYADEPGLRDRELKRIGVALGAASPTEPDATGAVAAIGALRTYLATVGLRPRLDTLGLDVGMLDRIAADAIADPALANAPRTPTVEQARRILGSVFDGPGGPERRSASR
jgi:alcohol dehydrogenase class IV